MATPACQQPATGTSAGVDALRRTFRPDNVAIIGAKDSSMTSYGVVEALDRVGFEGKIFVVNRAGIPAHGRPAARSCVEIGELVDTAVILTPAHAVLDVLDDAAAARIRTVVVLSAGWAEAGPEGQARQLALVAKAETLGITVVGPNCLGFMNLAARTGAWVANLPPLPRIGTVGVLSQSGGVGNALVDLASEFGIGVSHVITTGNESMITTTDALEYLIADESTSAVALFCEGIRDPGRFLITARQAAEAGKAIVVLKAGSSALAARNALSHTGSLVGDDDVIDTALRQYGVMRVRSLEELVVTSGLAAHTRPLGASGVAIVSISGGSVDIVADQADLIGLDLPQYDEAATAAIREILPGFATVQNPLDITGAALHDEFAQVLAVADKQDNIGVIGVLCNVPAHPSCKDPGLAGLLGTIGRGLTSLSKPGVLVSQTVAHANPYGQAAVADAGIGMVLPGLSLGTVALGRVAWWSTRLARMDRARPRSAGRGADVAVPDATGPLSELTSRAVLSQAGVPLVPATLVSSADDAVLAAAAYGGPVALKIVSRHILHKTDVGAVRLGVGGRAGDEQTVRHAYDSVVAAAASITTSDGHPAHVEGVLVAPMRSGGAELLVGVTRDQEWGLVLVVGLGGILVEVLGDVARRLIPVGPDDINEMLDELNGVAILGGVRGRPAVNRDAVVAAVDAVARAAASLGDRLESLEINPLRVDAEGAEALDALVVLRSGEVA